MRFQDNLELTAAALYRNDVTELLHVYRYSVDVFPYSVTLEIVDGRRGVAGCLDPPGNHKWL